MSTNANLQMHGCGGEPTGWWSMTGYRPFADQRGFIAIVPGTKKDNRCWEVNTARGLKHGGGGDADGIANMVKYVLDKYKADPKRVFATGNSSGGMMTNVLAATYPDVFAGGASFSGVAAGCLAGSKGASPQSADPTCANGKIKKTGAAWGAQVKAMYPSYKGEYPKMQIWHGTADPLVKYPNMAEELKEWSFLHNVQFTKNVTGSPSARYTAMIYGDGSKVVGYSGQGASHLVMMNSIPQSQKTVLDFFGV
jgi:acetylxylan esterase